MGRPGRAGHTQLRGLSAPRSRCALSRPRDVEPGVRGRVHIRALLVSLSQMAVFAGVIEQGIAPVHLSRNDLTDEDLMVAAEENVNHNAV